MILAIDPGPVESAYVILNNELKPIEFKKIQNERLLEKIKYRSFAVGINSLDDLAIEMVASYGMPVGQEVFETVWWIGRFWEVAIPMLSTKIYRKTDVCMNLCHTTKAKDKNIRQALIDRFGPVGTK